MRRAAFIVFVPILIAKICLAGLIIETSKLDESRLVEVSIDILESCYGDRFTTVGLAGPSAGNIMTMMSLRNNMISTTLIDDTSRLESRDPVDRGARYKLQVFVITTINQNALVKTLKQVEESKWWNHMASFLLIGWPEGENECSNAPELLWAAWKMNLLNSKFVCLHQTRGYLIYTFNPYTSKAPSPWQQEDTYEGINGHIWTLFAREYREEESSCERLDFDKTIDLGGYEIRAAVKGMENWWSVDPDKKPALGDRVHNVTAQILMSSLNATWNVLSEPANGSGIVLAEAGEIHSLADLIRFGIIDICLNIMPQHYLQGSDTTYPVNKDDLAILTQHPGNKSQVDKIISVLDRSSRFCVFVVFLITLLFFKFWLGKPLIASILDLVLILCNAALHKIPKKLAPRIYLATLFMFVVTLQGIYQGQFASLLTKEVPLPGVNTIEDLARSKHTIYSSMPYKIFFNESAFSGRYFPSGFVGCVPNVVNEPEAACVDVTSRLTTAAATDRLHLSRKTMGVVYGSYLIRRDWPLEDRVNLIFGRAAAAGIMEHLYSVQRDSEINRIKTYENEKQEPRPKVLTLIHLKFAFVFLGIGLGCATVTFIIEVAFFKATTRNSGNRVQRRVKGLRR